jgi:hypothetical protein
MTKIAPIDIPTQGVATYLILSCMTLDMTANNAQFYYELVTDVLPIYNNSYKVLVTGNLQMNENDFNQWGADNNYCIQWAANQLNLTIIE